jgi:hypothetical protein
MRNKLHPTLFLLGFETLPMIFLVDFDWLIGAQHQHFYPPIFLLGFETVQKIFLVDLD